MRQLYCRVLYSQDAWIVTDKRWEEMVKAKQNFKRYFINK